jgi:hypothetical protein
MRISVSKIDQIVATAVWFDVGMIHVRLKDQRVVSVPIDWFPRLKSASPEQREKWRFVSGGIGIHWPDLDEDISVAALLK